MAVMNPCAVVQSKREFGYVFRQCHFRKTAPAFGGGFRRSDFHQGLNGRVKKRYGITLAMHMDQSVVASLEKSDRVALLWFKKDLRLDDHPGLCSAASFDALLPVYIFDPYLLRGWSTYMLEGLVDAIGELKLGLQGIGSDLVIRCGSTKSELLALIKEVYATDIITEEEIEHEWREVLSSLGDNLGQAGAMGFNIKTWKAPLYEAAGKDFPVSYKEFQRMPRSVLPPLQASMSLPTFPNIQKKGDIPLPSDIENSIKLLLGNSMWHMKLKDLQIIGAEAFLSSQNGKQALETPTDRKGGILESFNNWREKYILASPYEAYEKRKQELAMNSKEEVRSTGIGATSAMGTLEAYLRFLEPTRRKDWKLLYEVVLEAERKGPKGASFRAIFGSALTLGTLSRRRIYHEAFAYEKARNGGLNSPFGFSTFTAAAAVQEVKSAEWYRMLAAATQVDTRKNTQCIRFWCWRGFLIQYNTMGNHGLPVVLVHGFGAFWEHYRDNINSLADQGTRVWALTLLGFGRSEKPDVAYTEVLWAELIRDFIMEVVGEPVVLVGNSIGGYMVSMVSGLWPEIVKSLILLNSAGKICPDLSPSYFKPSARTGVTWAGAQLSLSYLRSAATQLLKKYYPVNPSRVDDRLSSEILRASHDPGAAVVLESFFCLKTPFPLNWFLDRYRGKVFVIQGTKDALSNSMERKKLFESYCSNAVVQLVDAGHCPHDEIPEQINSLILGWLQVTTV